MVIMVIIACAPIRGIEAPATCTNRCAATLANVATRTNSAVCTRRYIATRSVSAVNYTQTILSWPDTLAIYPRWCNCHTRRSGAPGAVANRACRWPVNAAV